MAQARPGSTKLRGLSRFAPIAILAAGLAIGYALGWHRLLTLDALVASRDVLAGAAAAHPVLAPLAFFVVYALAVAFSFPVASVLTIFGGFLFGWAVGGVLVALAATLGATALFLAARTALGDGLRARVSGTIARISAGFEEDAFFYLLVLRLAPVFPFFVVNLAPAFCNIRLRTFVTATFLGILPGTFAYAYLGQGIDSVIAAAQAAGSTVTPGDLVTPQITLAFAVLALVAALPLVVRRFGFGRGAGG